MGGKVVNDGLAFRFAEEVIGATDVLRQFGDCGKHDLDSNPMDYVRQGDDGSGLTTKLTGGTPQAARPVERIVRRHLTEMDMKFNCSGMTINLDNERVCDGHVKHYCIGVQERDGDTAAHYWAFSSEQRRAQALVEIEKRTAYPGGWGKALVLFTRTVDDIRCVTPNAELTGAEQAQLAERPR